MPRIRIRIDKTGRTTFAVEGVGESAESVVSLEQVQSLTCVKLTQALEQAVGIVEERKLHDSAPGSENIQINEQLGERG